MDRKDFLRYGLRDLLKEAAGTPVGRVIDRQLLGLANILDPRGLGSLAQTLNPQPDTAPGPGSQKDAFFLARPPGALVNPKEFDSACTKCGDCIVACPYGTLFKINPESGPLLDPNSHACHLCPDTPCIAACETGALVPLPKGSFPGFGQARVSFEHCLNTMGRPAGSKPPKKLCKECVKSCPVPDAVALDRAGLPTFTDSCTGCGLCREACPADYDTIRVI